MSLLYVYPCVANLFARSSCANNPACREPYMPFWISKYTHPSGVLTSIVMNFAFSVDITLRFWLWWGCPLVCHSLQGNWCSLTPWQVLFCLVWLCLYNSHIILPYVKSLCLSGEYLFCCWKILCLCSQSCLALLVLTGCLNCVHDIFDVIIPRTFIVAW